MMRAKKTTCAHQNSLDYTPSLPQICVMCGIMLYTTVNGQCIKPSTADARLLTTPNTVETLSQKFVQIQRLRKI